MSFCRNLHHCCPASCQNDNTPVLSVTKILSKWWHFWFIVYSLAFIQVVKYHEMAWCLCSQLYKCEGIVTYPITVTRNSLIHDVFRLFQRIYFLIKVFVGIFILASIISTYHFIIIAGFFLISLISLLGPVTQICVIERGHHCFI